MKGVCVAKRKKDELGWEENAVEIAEVLQRAKEMLPAGAELGTFEAYVEEGMLDHAWEELRTVAGEHAVPLAFWGEMSRAAEMLGGAP